MPTLVLVLKKGDDKTKYDSYYSHSKVGTVTNESDIDDVFESIYNIITSSIPKSLRKGTGWIIDSVIERDTNI